MKWYRRIIYSFLVFFLLLGAFMVLIESSFGREILKSYLLASLKKESIHVKIGSIDGDLPRELTLQNIELDLPNGSHLAVDTLKAQISLFALLKREISLKQVEAYGVAWTSHREPRPEGRGEDLEGASPLPNSELNNPALKDRVFSKPDQLLPLGSGENSRSSRDGKAASEPHEGSQPLSLPNLALSLKVKSFVAEDVSIDGIDQLHIKGAIHIGSKGHHLFLDLGAERAGDKVRFMILAKKNGTFHWKAELNIADSTVLDPIYPLPVQGMIQMKVYAKSEPGQETQGRLEGSGSLRNIFEPLQTPWTFKAKFTHPSNGDWLISHGHLDSDLVRARGSAKFDANGAFIESTGQIQSDRPIYKPLDGKLVGRWFVKKEGDAIVTKTVAHLSDLKWGPFEWKDMELLANSTGKTGSVSLKGDAWNVDGNFALGETIQFTELKIDSPEIKGAGHFEFFKDQTIVGSSELAIENLHILKPLYPDLDPYGKLSLKTEWKGKDVRLDLSGSNLYLRSFYFEKGSFFSDLHDPFGELTGVVSIGLEKGFLNDLQVDSASFETKISGENWPYALFAEGVWKRDFETHAAGDWHFDKKLLTGTIDRWKGLFYNQPFSLAAPVHFEWSPTNVQIGNTQIDLAAASLTGRFHKEGDSGELYLRLEQFPLDFLSLNPLEVSITGQLDFEGQIKEVHKKLQGNFNAALKYVEISSLGVANPINAEGMFSGRLDQDTLLFQGALSARDEPLASIDVKVPLRVELQPLRAEFQYSKPASGKLNLNGRIEDLLDFFDLGSHWLEGNCVCNLRLSNTLGHPVVEGECRLEDGFYENYITGTQAADIQAELLAEKDTLYLRSLSAKDPAGKGSLKGDGQIRLRIDERLPFKAHLVLQKFNFVGLDFVDSAADGAIDLKGDLDSAIATGDIHLIKTDISIPENISRKLPNLQVVYLNAQKPPEPIRRAVSKTYPLHLDLKISAPSGVIISGRGLQSEWKGSVVLGGTPSALQPKGKLELVKGEFNFSGRAFKLTQGALAFTGQGVPELNLTGSLEQQGISILVNLEGPLNSPQLTFQSIPALPLSAIIAHLLFGQDISEINGLQALQLATSVAKIAGEGPDVLETTRRSLGIDRLRILSAPNDEGGEAFSIQVGKYVAKGVIVSISQSTENRAPNISIEVDIGAGFYFQAESDQTHDQAQGKFAFKWNRNY